MCQCFPLPLLPFAKKSLTSHCIQQNDAILHQFETLRRKDSVIDQ